MDYINFKGATRHLGAPPGWNDNPNNPPVYVTVEKVEEVK